MKTAVQQFKNIYQYSLSEKDQIAIQVLSFKKDESILTVGEKVKGIYFLINGSYYVSNPEINGKELLLRRCTPPSILGDIEIFQHCDIQSNCHATEACTFIFVPTELYEQSLKKDPAFTELLLKELTFKLKTCTTLSRVNALSSVSIKLAAYLCTTHTKNTYDGYLIVENNHHIANLIGTTNRHVNRVLKRWEDEKIIERNNEKIKILDFERLSIVAEDIRYK